MVLDHNINFFYNHCYKFDNQKSPIVPETLLSKSTVLLSKFSKSQNLLSNLKDLENFFKFYVMFGDLEKFSKKIHLPFFQNYSKS